MASPDGPARVLLVDDDADVRSSLTQYLDLVGFAVDAVPDALTALARLPAAFPDVVLADVRMPRMTGLDLLAEIRRRGETVPVVLLSGHGDVPMAVDAMKRGAFDFLTKPYIPEHLAAILERAVEVHRLTRRVTALETRLAAAEGLERRIVGSSPAVEALRSRILTVAPLPVDVLIVGETGTGKELVARALHDFSPRRARPFVAVNSAAMPAEMVESELFGHEAGAFTSARDKRIGKFEYAQGGTVFLDEIESMPLPVQAKILRVLQERTVERLGSNRTIALDVRIVVAAKYDLRDLVATGAVRSDLYYRLAQADVSIPPLRERGDDVLLLFDHFAAAMARQVGRPRPPLDQSTAARLLTRDWPGNVRELKAAAERFALGLDGGATGRMDPGGALSLADRLARFERAVLAEALERHGGAVAPVLEELDLPRRTFNEKMARLGLRRE